MHAGTGSWRLAWRNLGRNRKRTAMALVAIALGQFAFLATASLIRGYSDDWLDSITGPMIGHIQVHAPKWREDRSVELLMDEVDQLLKNLRADAAVRHASPRLFAPMLAAAAKEAYMGVVVGVDAAAETHESGLLPGALAHEQLGGRRVLLGQNFARNNGIAVGSELALIGQDVDGSIANDLYTVAGLLASPLEIVSTMGIVMTLTDAGELLRAPNQAHEIILHLHDPALIASSSVRLAAQPWLAGLELLPWYEVVPQFVALIDFVDVYTLIILILVFVAAAAGIANTMLMSTFERTREFGMLLALGCGPARISRLLAVEAVLLGLAGVVTGTLLGLAFVWLTGESGIDYAALSGESSYEVGFGGMQFSSLIYPRLYLRDILSGLGAVLLTSFLATLWPMLHIVRLEPMAALRT